MSYILLEPIKTALAEGRHADARKLRYELVRELAGDMAGAAAELEVDSVWEAEQALKLLGMLDAITIPEKP